MLENLRDRLRGGKRLEDSMSRSERVEKLRNNLADYKEKNEEERLKKQLSEERQKDREKNSLKGFGISMSPSPFGKRKENWTTSFGGSFAGVRKIEGKRYDSKKKKRRER